MNFGKTYEPTVCPGSSDPFYIVSQLYKMGHYFLDTQYNYVLQFVVVLYICKTLFW